jgi:hypothetical protein
MDAIEVSCGGNGDSSSSTLLIVGKALNAGGYIQEQGKCYLPQNFMNQPQARLLNGDVLIVGGTCVGRNGENVIASAGSIQEDRAWVKFELLAVI